MKQSMQKFMHGLNKEQKTIKLIQMKKAISNTSMIRFIRLPLLLLLLLAGVNQLMAQDTTKEKAPVVKKNSYKSQWLMKQYYYPFLNYIKGLPDHKKIAFLE